MCSWCGIWFLSKHVSHSCLLDPEASKTPPPAFPVRSGIRGPSEPSRNYWHLPGPLIVPALCQHCDWRTKLQVGVVCKSLQVWLPLHGRRLNCYYHPHGQDYWEYCIVTEGRHIVPHAAWDDCYVARRLSNSWDPRNMGEKALLINAIVDPT